MIQTEQLGFDEEINIIVQPKKKGKVDFEDYKVNQAPEVETKVYANVKFGQKTFIPADREILISFAPIRNHKNNNIGPSHMGQFRFRTWYQQYIEPNERRQRDV